MTVGSPPPYLAAPGVSSAGMHRSHSSNSLFGFFEPRFQVIKRLLARHVKNLQTTVSVRRGAVGQELLQRTSKQP